MLNTVIGINVLATASGTQRLPHSNLNIVTELTLGTQKLGAVFKHTKPKQAEATLIPR